MNMEQEHFSQSNETRQRPKAPNSSAGKHTSGKGPGRYLKDNPKPRRTGTRRRRRKLNPRFVILLAVTLAVLIVIAVAIGSCSMKPKIIGRWDLDGTTVYEFRKGGKGKLELMTGDFTFTYEIIDQVIYIDFNDEYAVDSRYQYDIEGKMLFLNGGPGDSRNEYILYRIK